MQLAPSGRAVAFVHPAHYDALAGGERIASLACVGGEARALFEPVPDSLVVVLNADHPLVRFNRFMIELGYDPFEPPDPRPPALIAAAEQIDNGPAPNATAFNQLIVPFANGIGEADATPESPRDFHSYLYLPVRQDLAGGSFVHEFAHNWAARIDAPPAFARQIARFGKHWGFSAVGGMLGGWAPGSRIELAPGHYRAAASPAGRQPPIAPFAPLELYLMGLIGPEDVPPFEVAVEPVRIVAQGLLTVDFTTPGFETIAIEDLIARNGPRTPAHADAPRHFELALVILAGAALSVEEWEFYERVMDFMTARDGRRIEEVFAAEQFRADRALWRATEHVAKSALLNFSAATGQRASLGFSPPRVVR